MARVAAVLTWAVALVASLAVFAVRLPVEGWPALIYVVLAALCLGRFLDVVFDA